MQSPKSQTAASVRVWFYCKLDKTCGARSSEGPIVSFKSKNVIDHDNCSNYISTSFPNIRSRVWTHFNLLDHFWDPIFDEIALESAIWSSKMGPQTSADGRTNEHTHTHHLSTMSCTLSYTIGPSDHNAKTRTDPIYCLVHTLVLPNTITSNGTGSKPVFWGKFPPQKSKFVGFQKKIKMKSSKFQKISGFFKKKHLKMKETSFWRRKMFKLFACGAQKLLIPTVF